MKFSCIFIICACIPNGFSSEKTLPEFTERFHWSPANYDFEGDNPQLNETSDSLWDFAPDEIHPWKNKLFFILSKLTLHPDLSQIPLVYINLNTTEKSPLFIPYPKNHTNQVNSTLVLEIDICNRLWIIDTITDKLFIIDLNLDKVIRIVNLHPNLELYIFSITVDVNKSDCENAYAYMINSIAKEILVYRFKDNKYWATESPKFVNDKGENYHLTGPPLTMYSSAISNHHGTSGHRVLYVQPSVSKYLLGVSTDILQNSENATTPLNFTVLGYRQEPYNSSIIYFDEKNSILFYNILFQPEVLGCWNTKRYPNEFSPNTTHLIQTSSNVELKTIRDIESDDENNLLVVTRNWRDYHRYDLYLYTINIKDLVKDTVCDIV